MNNNLKIRISKDSSTTIYNQEIDECYHSDFGAIQESEHVFIKNGLHKISKKHIRVFEMGFGTGLNALLSKIYADNNKLDISYHTIELYPIDTNLINQLNYNTILKTNADDFRQMHQCEWNKEVIIDRNFIFRKFQDDFRTFNLSQKYDLIYFDAFSPEKNPELWTEQQFIKLFSSLNNGGLLTSYSSKGVVKQNLRKAGFKVIRLKGPEGKRHILNAIK